MDHVAELYPHERADSQKPYGSVDYADPGYQNDNVKRYPLDSAEHCKAAWSYINMPKNAGMYSADQLANMKSRIKAAAKKFGITIADEDQPHEQQRMDTSILYRAAAVNDVNHAERIITTIVTPYEQSTVVSGGVGIGCVGLGRQGEPWEEVISRGAFDGVESAPHRIRSNRDHDPTKPVGKGVRFWQDPVGLIGEIKIAKTDLGSETLELADEGVLSASAAFGLRDNGREVDRLMRRCRINSAYLNHVAFVMNPAYVGAEVLSVRATPNTDLLPESSGTATPSMDQFIGDPVFAWAYDRLHKSS